MIPAPTAPIRRFAVTWRVLAATSLVALATAAEPVETVVVRFDSAWRTRVARSEANSVRLAPDEIGLVVWSGMDGERWQVFRGTWQRPETTVRRPRGWTGVARNPGSGEASDAAISQLTTQLDPLLSPSVVKAIRGRQSGTLLTPPDGGVLLRGTPTIRRIAEPRRPLGRAMLVLSDGSREVRISWAEKQERVRFEEIADRPSAWKDELPAGNYTLRFENESRPAVNFAVETAGRREPVQRWLDEWPAETLIAVEYLLGQQPLPYLADALDALDRVPVEKLSPYLRWRRAFVIALLRGVSEPPPLAEDSTGIAAVDQARRLIDRGRWDEALKSLDETAKGDARTRALADLYRGVIQAESGLGQEESADFYFRRAITGLTGGAPADALRVHNNYANYLLARAQDRVFNHAFPLAAGVRGVFLTALLSWDEARKNYETALERAEKLTPADQASVHANLTRLYLVLADLLATLDSPDQRQLQPAEQAAQRTAAEHAKLASSAEPGVQAVVAMLQAQLAFRQGDFAAAREFADQARERFVQAGSLAGVESVERLLGQLAVRRSSNADALPHFRRSHLLAEFLRSHVPADRAGLTRAGFFARRTFVYEQLVELLIAEHRDVEALQFAELAKARALQDLLVTNRDAPRFDPGLPRDVAEILASWPRDVIALEYFLATRRAWVFVVSPDGGVKAHAMVDNSRDLVARIQAVLATDFADYSAKMRQRILDKRGLDHEWQTTLHRLYGELIPAEARAKFGSRLVLIVPHHVLHYFPFAALVTQPDSVRRGPLEMVQPRFLIDEPCRIGYAPSLVVWDLLRQRPDRPVTDVAAVGIPEHPKLSPLPGVTAELRAIQAAFGGRVKPVLIGTAAHRESTLGLLRQPGLLLIGTHGQNWPDRPLESELYLHPRGRDDGRLTAAELYAGEVRRDVTVLSACYTALADKSPLPGDDLFGLQRALLQTGGRTVVSGQWDLYDQTGPELMENFFRHFAQGRSAAEALAEAQRQFLKKLRSSGEPEPWLHPYFWSAYTVAGDDRTRFARP